MSLHEALTVCYAIPGWCWPSELSWLFGAFQNSKTHLEVGSYCGKSLAATAYGMSAKSTIYSVDDFRGAQVSVDWTRAVLLATIEHLRKRTRVAVVRLQQSSVDAAIRLRKEGVQFDSVYIDACHHYAECKADIEMFQPFVKRGGMIAGHDYCASDLGVMDAVNETGPFKVVPDTRIWYRTITES